MSNPEKVLLEPDCPKCGCTEKAIELCRKCGFVFCKGHVNDHEKRGECSILE